MTTSSKTFWGYPPNVLYAGVRLRPLTEMLREFRDHFWGPDFEAFAKGIGISTAQNWVSAELQIGQILSGDGRGVSHFFSGPVFGHLDQDTKAIPGKYQSKKRVCDGILKGR